MMRAVSSAFGSGLETMATAFNVKRRFVSFAAAARPSSDSAHRAGETESSIRGAAWRTSMRAADKKRAPVCVDLTNARRLLSYTLCDEVLLAPALAPAYKPPFDEHGRRRRPDPEIKPSAWNRRPFGRRDCGPAGAGRHLYRNQPRSREEDGPS